MSWLILAAAAAVIVTDAESVREEPPPHGAIGMSTAYRISDKVPDRTFEFRRRVLHQGAEIGVHPIDHDEIYYILSGQGEVTSAGKVTPVGPGTAVYFYSGDEVGIRQLGDEPLNIIITYPLTDS